jgi:hypothetical protein
MLNIGRFHLFPGSSAEYSARCLTLMQESTVIDGLAPLSIDGKWQAWATAPETFTESVFQRYKSSGIHVFHHAFGWVGRIHTTRRSATRWCASSPALTST